MFSPDIVGSDAFLEMPTSSRELYFQLGMYADDDGFVNPKKIVRLVGASDDDLKILITKRFCLPFENGIIVIKHWKINNLVRKDWYRPTQYLEQRKALFIKPNGIYTFDETQGKPFVNEMLTSSLTQVRLGKVKEGGSQSEHSFPLEEREVALDPNGDPILGKPAKAVREPPNKLAFRIRERFIQMCEKEVGHPPLPDGKGYKAVCNALKKLKPKEIIDLFEDWFASGLADDRLIHLNQALSNYQIENYRLNHGITS